MKDFIYTHIDKGMKYEDLKERVQVLATNKSSMDSGPVPMDTGEVDDSSNSVGQLRQEVFDEYEVEAVGAHRQCRRCGGFGHLARTCPSGPV